MKAIIQFLFPTVKAILAVCGFFVGIGWGAYAAVQLIVDVKADDLRKEMYQVREVDKSHFDSRLDRMESKIDKLLERK